MKLTYFQLETQLTKTLASAYLVSGDEPFLKNDAIAQIRRAAIAQRFTNRVRLTLQSGFDEGQLFNALHNVTFLAEKRLVEIDCQDALPSKDTAAILEEYALNPKTDTILLFSLNKVDAKITKTNWFKAYEALGIHVAIWPIPPEQMPQWINQRARKYKLQLTPAAIQLLSEYMSGNLTAAASAIEKIYLLRINQAIDENTIRLVIGDESRFSLFDLMDYILAKDSARILQILQTLKEEGIEPTLVLWALTRELRLLLAMTEQVNTTSIDSLLQRHRIFPRRQANIRRFLQQVKPEQCLQWLSKAAYIDCLLKGSISGNIWQTLEQYCLQIALA